MKKNKAEKSKLPANPHVLRRYLDKEVSKLDLSIYDSNHVITLIQLIAYDQVAYNELKAESQDLNKIESYLNEILLLCKKYPDINSDYSSIVELVEKIIKVPFARINSMNTFGLHDRRLFGSKKSNRFLSYSCIIDLIDYFSEAHRNLGENKHQLKAFEIAQSVFDQIGFSRDIAAWYKEAKKMRKKYPDLV